VPMELGGLTARPTGLPAGLEGLAAAIGQLAGQDPAEHSDVRLAEQVLALHRLVDQLDGACLRLLATVDARGAAGAEAGVTAGSTAGWLRAALRMSPGTASRRVRTARALHRGPLAATASALAAGDVSVQHATVLAEATHDLPPTQVIEAEGVLVDAARRLDPGRLRRLTTHLREVINPDATEARTQARLDKRGLWLSATYDGMVAVDGLLDPEAGEAVRAALLPLARPAGPEDARSAAQRRADGLAELARQALQGGRLPRAGGLRPQLTVTVELASLLAGHGVGGTGGWGGVLPGETLRRLACDATITRAIVHRHPQYPAISHDGHPGAASGYPNHTATHPDRTRDPDHTVTHPDRTGRDPDHTSRHPGLATAQAHYGGGWPGVSGRASPDGNATGLGGDGGADGGLAARLHRAVALLPAPLGAPTQLLDLGRATRLISPALRRALAVRDGGCVAAGCDRPASWTDAHHLIHWLHGGATNLDNLVLLCRTHHRAAHEGGWRLRRHPTSGRRILTPPARRHSP
jgi:hypothetical protein